MLKVGDKAPQFTATDHNGNTITLSDFSGKKIILYFYPKDNTPGCTAEACNLRDNFNDLLKKGFVVIGVSADSVKSHQSFISKYNLPFTLISDTDKTICKLYGVWGQKKFLGKVFEGIKRTTFIISEDGTIEHIIHKVDTKNHTHQILQELKMI